MILHEWSCWPSSAVLGLSVRSVRSVHKRDQCPSHGDQGLRCRAIAVPLPPRPRRLGCRHRSLSGRHPSVLSSATIPYSMCTARSGWMHCTCAAARSARKTLLSSAPGLAQPFMQRATHFKATRLTIPALFTWSQEAGLCIKV